MPRRDQNLVALATKPLMARYGYKNCPDTMPTARTA
jgi:hypothetical protein